MFSVRTIPCFVKYQSTLFRFFDISLLNKGLKKTSKLHCFVFSVPGCSSDGVHWFRFSDDVPQEVRVRRCGVQLLHRRPGGSVGHPGAGHISSDRTGGAQSYPH